MRNGHIEQVLHEVDFLRYLHDAQHQLVHDVEVRAVRIDLVRGNLLRQIVHEHSTIRTAEVLILLQIVADFLHFVHIVRVCRLRTLDSIPEPVESGIACNKLVEREVHERSELIGIVVFEDTCRNHRFIEVRFVVDDIPHHLLALLVGGRAQILVVVGWIDQPVTAVEQGTGVFIERLIPLGIEERPSIHPVAELARCSLRGNLLAPIAVHQGTGIVREDGICGVAVGERGACSLACQAARLEVTAVDDDVAAREGVRHRALMYLASQHTRTSVPLALY